MPVRPYEVVYIIDPDVVEENSVALVERFRALAEAQGATDLRVDTQILGKRRLAYAINHKRDGQYVVMNFQSEAAAPAELERVLNITDGVLRSMVIRLEEMPPEPVIAPPPAAPAPAPEPEPVVAEPAPEAPAAEETAPEAPAAEEAAPVAEQAAPAVEETAPAAEETAPAVEEAAPAAEAPAAEAPTAEETA
ncbi:MAG TPA: 30S ribosomal protein S6 [Armatimonadota bacterium]|jgi:small subunit ribosomal protein S6